MRGIPKAAIALAAALLATAANAGCDLAALRRSADGWSVYQAAPSFFRRWCAGPDDALQNTLTAVHETTHYLTSERGGYPLVGGGVLPLIPEGGPAPAKILRGMFHDDYSGEYLTMSAGHASSGQIYTYLLDELNAYAREAKVARDMGRSSREGMAALASYVRAYAARVQLFFNDTATTDILLAQADRL